MEWLSPAEAYIFETHGFCVIEDVVSSDALAQMNRWIDANPDRLSVRGPALRLDARDTPREGRVAPDPAPRLTGSHGRADFGVLGKGLGEEWEDPEMQCFRDLVASPTLVRCAQASERWGAHRSAPRPDTYTGQVDAGDDRRRDALGQHRRHRADAGQRGLYPPRLGPLCPAA